MGVFWFISWIVILVDGIRFLVLFCIENCIVLFVFIDDVISYVLIVDCKWILFLKKWLLVFVIVFFMLSWSVDCRNIVFELLEFEVYVVILDDVFRKLYCFKKNCFLMFRFLVVVDKVNGIDNFFKILFFDNFLVILNMSLGCGCLGEFLGKWKMLILCIFCVKSSSDLVLWMNSFSNFFICLKL